MAAKFRRSYDLTDEDDERLGGDELHEDTRKLREEKAQLERMLTGMSAIINSNQFANKSEKWTPDNFYEKLREANLPDVEMGEEDDLWAQVVTTVIQNDRIRDAHKAPPSVGQEGWQEGYLRLRWGR